MLTLTCLFEDRLRNNTSVCRYEVESYGWIVRKDVILNISADFSFWVFAFYSFSTKDVCFLFFSLIHLSVNCKCDSKLLNKREIDAHRPYWLKLEITLWILLCRSVNRRGEWLSGSSCIIREYIFRLAICFVMFIQRSIFLLLGWRTHSTVLELETWERGYMFCALSPFVFSRLDNITVVVRQDSELCVKTLPLFKTPSLGANFS